MERWWFFDVSSGEGCACSGKAVVDEGQSAVAGTRSRLVVLGSDALGRAARYVCRSACFQGVLETPHATAVLLTTVVGKGRSDGKTSRSGGQQCVVLLSSGSKRACNYNRGMTRR